MKSLVKKILRGRQRIETDRIIAFRSHWSYQSEYCNPASGNEKGGVEGELGWFRRNCLVPVPEASDLATFNEQLLGICKRSRTRTIEGKSQTVGEARDYELAFLKPMAEEGFPIQEILYPLNSRRTGTGESEDQLVLSTDAAGLPSDGGSGSVEGDDPPRQPLRGRTPALLWARSPDS